jgi:transcriptional regulator with XRE-family HTH domain
MKDRILQFLEAEKISPAEFADKIGVQRSSMSHILNGRNYPSASFIQKMLEAYPRLNSRWLLIGAGMMNMETPEASQVSNAVGALPTSDRQAGTSQPADINPEFFAGGGTDSLVAGADYHSSPGSDDSFHPQEEDTGSSSKALNPKASPFSPGSGDALKADTVSNLESPLSALLAEEKEPEQVLFFFKDKTFRVYRPS